MSITFCAGTAAELIKLAPLIGRSERTGTSWSAVFTGQAPKSFLVQWHDFGFDISRLTQLEIRDDDLSSSQQAAAWMLRTGARMVLPRRQHPAFASKGLWLVHGDTLSTLTGAILGRRLGVRVAHIEAGLRSNKMWDPFPEEICRKLVARIATLHFAPEREAYNNLLNEGVRGDVEFTDGNTQIDAVLEALASVQGDAANSDTGYMLVNIHRFETMMSADRGAQVKEILRQAASMHRLVIVSHATTQAWVDKDPSFKRELEMRGSQWLPRQPFTRFVQWLVRAKGLISDSGGNQEECAMLGVPCLLLRHVTERELPMDRTNVVLSQFRQDRVQPFLRDPASYALPRRLLTDSPADKIFASLQKHLAT